MEASRPTAEAMLKAFEDLYAGKSQDEVVNELLAVSFENFAKRITREIISKAPVTGTH